MSKVLQNAPLEAFCNTFDRHQALIGLENHFFFFLRVAVLHRPYCRVVICVWQNWPTILTNLITAMKTSSTTASVANITRNSPRGSPIGITRLSVQQRHHHSVCVQRETNFHQFSFSIK